MALPLKDFRGKITPETDCVLESINRTSGRDRSEIVREILHAWALEKIDQHSVLSKLLAGEGLLRASEGIAGNQRESRGASGRVREEGGEYDRPDDRL